MTVCVCSATGSKYNQESSDLTVMMDMASWEYPLRPVTQVEGWRNKGKKIPSESLLRQWQKDNTRCHLRPLQFSLSYSVPNVILAHHFCTQMRNPDQTNFDSSPSLSRPPSHSQPSPAAPNFTHSTLEFSCCPL